jgi:hypothetical protein
LEKIPQQITKKENGKIKELLKIEGILPKGRKYLRKKLVFVIQDILYYKYKLLYLYDLQ